MQKMWIAALLGGITLFAWGAFSHMVLPLGMVGLSTMPNEVPVLDAMARSIPSRGLYFFPGIDMANATPEAQKAWEARLASGPSGLLVYRPSGARAMSPVQLVRELITNILSCLLASILLRPTGAPYWSQVRRFALLGVAAWLISSVPNWNWYGFPTSFTLADGVGDLVGWALVGMVVTRFQK